MSVYVGIDVHRKRSQVAVIGQSGGVLTNRNVTNGAEPILKVIGGLPPGTPAAFEAAFGTSWLVELLEDYGFTPAPGAPVAVQGDRLGPLEERQGGRGDFGPVAARGRPQAGHPRLAPAHRRRAHRPQPAAAAAARAGRR
jgi:hypothetical protein